MVLNITFEIYNPAKMSAEKSSSKVLIAVAVIGALATIIAAVIGAGKQDKDPKPVVAPVTSPVAEPDSFKKPSPSLTNPQQPGNTSERKFTLPARAATAVEIDARNSFSVIEETEENGKRIVVNLDGSKRNLRVGDHWGFKSASGERVYLIYLGKTDDNYLFKVTPPTQH